MTLKSIRMHLGAVIAVATALLATSTAQAALIVAGTTIFHGRAIQDITLLPGTPLNGTGQEVTLADVFGDGYLIFYRDAQVGNTIVIPKAFGQFSGSDARLGGAAFTFGGVGTLTEDDFSATITNITQDPGSPGFATGDPSSLATGEMSFGGNSFGFRFDSGPLTGVILYTDPSVPFSFATSLDGLPPTPGTTFLSTGNDQLPILFGTTVVGYSSNRRIVLTAVPEPSTLALGLIGLVAVAVTVSRRRRAVARGTRASIGG